MRGPARWRIWLSAPLLLACVETGGSASDLRVDPVDAAGADPNPVVDAAEPPVDAAEPPVDAAEPPVDAAEPPVDAVEPPVDAVEPPVDAAEPPVDAAEPPVDGAEPPVDAAEPPVDAGEGLDAGVVRPDAAEPPIDAAASPLDAGDSMVDALGSPLDAAEPPVDAAEPEPCAHPARADLPDRERSWRHGGGAGYPDLVDPEHRCVHLVDTREALEAALEVVQAGETVYVQDDARIDLTGATLTVPEGVWLASGRGRGDSAGALLFADDIRRPLFRIGGDDVRVTGLRIWGFDRAQCPPAYPDACTEPDRTNGANCRDCTPPTIGLQASGVDRLEVDNNDLAGWSHAAVRLTDSVDNRVHHNFIHHTQRQGLGYGVVLIRGGEGLVSVLIDWNRFDYNRQAVAGSGEPGQDYEARDNLVLPHANGHVFDMHGHDENTDNGSEWAGGDIRIHRNTVLVPDRYAMVIRGRPQHGAWLYDNCLARREGQAALQRFFFGDMHVDRGPDGPAPNRYAQSAADCRPLRWCISPGGEAPDAWLGTSNYGLARLGVADLDGDGRSDIFRADGEAWWWSAGGRAGWAQLIASNRSLDELAFGDFDGDGADDVFHATGAEWRYSAGGSAQWAVLRQAPQELEALRFGDLDGDGTTDVFTVSGGDWQWSRSGTAAWARLRAAEAELGRLALADLDGDGADDVFWGDGQSWFFSPGGSGAPQALARSSVRVPDVRLADLDGDGVADVFRSSATSWQVSWGGRGPWMPLRVSSESELGFGDFDGDGRAEVLRTGCL